MTRMALFAACLMLGACAAVIAPRPLPEAVEAEPMATPAPVAAAKSGDAPVLQEDAPSPDIRRSAPRERCEGYEDGIGGTGCPDL